MAARDAQEQASAQEEHDAILRVLERLVTDISEQLSIPEAVAGVHKVSELKHLGDRDPIHETALDRLFFLAEQLPYEISYYLNQSPAPR
ncbi:hypothetical protein E1265_30560 [Streptomyces sp. 8K308]|uniref:hypothetical protein n=1 Tax=Streptomyces sp. 8K308 TaxID=2530388 RepID=UPI00104C4B03|nr:hypothetical protein [Streptomyces sp. 8K308]TDC10950.1 hypothetical protein E1265_30560 [Streptomyces sp. 8K308]